MKQDLMRNIVARFSRAQEGSVAILVGIALLVLVIGAGAAVDMARAQMLQTKLQSAVDAAGLAAQASAFSVPDGQTKAEWTQTQAQRYFDVNFPTGYLGSSPITVTTSISPDGNTVQVTASTTQTTTIMRIAGIDSLDVAATSKVTSGTSGSGMELVLVLDNTGSMLCNVQYAWLPCDGGPDTKITALKGAADQLLDIVFGYGNDTAEGLYVGVVPFSQAVNIGTQNVDWAYAWPDVGQDAVDKYDWGPGGSWGGCVMYQRCYHYWSRYDGDPRNGACGLPPYWYPPAAADNQADADAIVAEYGFYWNLNPPPADNSIPAVYPIYGWRDDSTTPATYLSPLDTNMGPNKGCPRPLQALTASKANAKAVISGMVATGDTLIPEGLVWGGRVISEYWRGIWGGETATLNLPLDFNTPGSLKVVVLMTDGWNRLSPYNFSAYGFLWEAYDEIFSAYWGHYETTERNLDDITLEICSRLKADGVIIYTIGFGVPGTDPNDFSSVNASLLNDCATDANHFFLAPTNEDLQNAFRKIGQSLSNLRVSQ